MRTKQVSHARRSLRNATNGTKNVKGKKNKLTKSKLASGMKSKAGKSFLKNPKPSPPVSKRKREAEEEPAADLEDKPPKPSPQVSKRKRDADEEPDKDPEENREENPIETSEEKPEEKSEGAENGSSKKQEDGLVNPKGVRKAKARTRRSKKKRNNLDSEDIGWQTLEDFGDKESETDENKKKALTSQKGSDRRKQSLVERDIPCAVMVKALPVAVPIAKDDDSDCEVIDGTSSPRRRKGSTNNSSAVEVDVDEIQSETGSNFCEIIEEANNSLDFKKLYAQARRVVLPSLNWACHLDPRRQYVSFTRFNSEFPDSSSNIVDRTVIFKKSVKPAVFCNGRDTELPEEIQTVETLTNVSQILQHLNAMVLP